jgi:hypothetical protein
LQASAGSLDFPDSTPFLQGAQRVRCVVFCGLKTHFWEKQHTGQHMLLGAKKGQFALGTEIAIPSFFGIGKSYDKKDKMDGLRLPCRFNTQ